MQVVVKVRVEQGIPFLVVKDSEGRAAAQLLDNITGASHSMQRYMSNLKPSDDEKLWWRSERYVFLQELKAFAHEFAESYAVHDEVNDLYALCCEYLGIEDKVVIY